jgi:hypothetical protein
MSLRCKKLVHDNAMFEIEELSLPRESCQDAIDGEVYLIVDRRTALLSLYPWVLFRAHSHNEPEGLWIWDGIRGERVVYKSPTLAAADPLELEGREFDDISNRVRNAPG